MRILVHEFASGGGLAGRPVPPALAREGSAMLTALVADLAVLPGHEIVATSDPRYRLTVPSSVEIVTLRRSVLLPFPRYLDSLLARVDAAWLIAPETDRCLERLAARVERKGIALLGSGAAAIRVASDKARLAHILSRKNVPYPRTRSLAFNSPEHAWTSRLKTSVAAVGYPVVAKPRRGAGCESVWLVRNARELQKAVQAFRATIGAERLVVQEYVSGLAASVSLLADGRRAVALAVNAQCVRAGRPFAYQGGSTPLDHPLARQAASAAERACEAVPGLRGYIGVDVMLSDAGVVVIEINPRLTTAYLGVRQAVRENVAELALTACGGRLPTPPLLRRSIRFSSDGRILP
jgi:predicted ATP-grasp superfamily ATP-dependent carboligase